MTKEELNQSEGAPEDPEAGQTPGDPAAAEEGSAAETGPEAEVGPEVDEEILQEIEDFLNEGVASEEDAETGEVAEPDAPSEGGTELEEARAELSRLRDQHLRLAADFENFRKRANADLTGNWVRARADLVRSLVEGLDDLQRVSRFTSEDTTVEALIEGVDLVERNLLKALTDAGLQVLEPEGERFDPNTMEAMMRVPTEEDGQDEIVHQVFQKGYLFKDQLVRPARVSVYKDDD
jgi:molecular chaperone GrpE